MTLAYYVLTDGRTDKPHSTPPQWRSPCGQPLDSMMTLNANSTQTMTHAKRSTLQYWIRRNPPTGWWPIGWLALLALLLIGLVAVVYVAPSRVEAEVEREVSERLSAAGYPWARVNASGQMVEVTGTPPEPVSETLLASVARATECETSFGDKVCPTSVEVALQAPAKQAAAAVASDPARHYDFVFESKGDSLTLDGVVPSDTQSAHIEGRARERFEQVDNRLNVTLGLAKSADAAARDRALKVLARLESGQARYSDGTLTLTGIARSKEDEVSARRLFLQDPGEIRLGQLSLSHMTEVDRCDEELATVLRKTRLRFETASARLQPNSESVLRTLTEIAGRCPGSFRIEGHTDSDGAAAANRRLSQARANAVRTALVRFGIDPARLVAQGFGEAKPLASNDNEAGKAQNRRIEIVTVREPRDDAN